jgi:hypothetical protein
MMPIRQDPDPENISKLSRLAKTNCEKWQAALMLFFISFSLTSLAFFLSL